MSIQEDAFVHRGDTLPDGIERHVDAAPHSAYTDRQVLRAEIAAVFDAATPCFLEAPLLVTIRKFNDYLARCVVARLASAT